MKWIDSIGTESASGVEHGSLLSWVYSAPMLRRVFVRVHAGMVRSHI